ncbi:MAG: hypothetical protein HC804_06890 [Anaerolineae bacterium]|nr:hypothetical protein [Anaerolineae bacterium]
MVILTAVLTFTAFLPLIMLPGPVSGLAWHNRQTADDDVLGGVEWYYTYGLHPYRDEAAQFVPMLWCDRWPAYDYASGYDYITEAQKLYPPEYSGWFLFLNEPDLPGSDSGGQCGMSPKQAAYFYKAVVGIWPQARLVGPAVSHEDYRAGWVWLRQWYKEVVKLGLPLPERAALHTYLPGDPNAILDSYHEAVRPYANAPALIWITEFGHCQPAQARRMLAVFQSRADIDRYAWFTTRRGGCTDLFYDVPGYSLTALGQVWKDGHK